MGRVVERSASGRVSCATGINSLALRKYAGYALYSERKAQNGAWPLGFLLKTLDNSTVAMLTFNDLIRDCLAGVREIMPWDLAARMAGNPDLLVVDVREPYEFDAMHIRGSLGVPRGIIESACEWDYDETVPELAASREREIVVVCRSGRRSVMAAAVMQQLGYQNVVSLRTGLRGWNDYEEPLVDREGRVVDEDVADDFFTSKLRPDQRRPQPEDIR